MSDDTEQALVPIERVQRLATIITPEDAQAAGLYLREVRQAIRTIQAKYKQVRAEIKLSLAGVKKMETEDLAPYLDAETAIDVPLLAWRIADRQRVEVEQQAALARAREAERLNREASVAELTALAGTVKGIERTILKAQAKALAAAPITPRITEPVPEATKIAGVALVEYHHAEIRDFALLVQAVAQGRVPLAAVQGDMKFLNAQAESLGDELSYPGVVVVTTHGQTARGL